jgi:hypothetical protein
MARLDSATPGHGFTGVVVCDAYLLDQEGNALLDLSTRSTRFVAASVLEAVAVSAGIGRTTGGLQIAA